MFDSFPADASLLDRRRLALMIAGAAGALAFAPDAMASERAGRVDDVVGTAMAELRRDTRRLATGESIFVGDTVMTAEASRLGMMVGDATTVKLGAKARLRIDRFIVNAGGVLTLQSGAMGFERPHSATPQPMNIRGAFGMIAVRGTHFFAGPSRGKAGVLVLRGSVSVRSGGASVILNAGEGTDIARRGAPPSPPARWADARIAEALASLG